MSDVDLERLKKEKERVEKKCRQLQDKRKQLSDMLASSQQESSSIGGSTEDNDENK